MKIKSTLLSLGLGLASAGLAGAATTNYVYMTGSTAARNAVYFALATNVFDAAPSITTQGSGTPQKATYMTFGGSISNNPIIVKCDWSGSEAGILDLADNPAQQEQFLADTATTSSSSPGPFINSPVDLCMADNAVQFSKNPTAPVAGAQVCIIPFMLVKETGSASDLSNVTASAFRQALLQAGIPLAQFTGNSADDFNYVYVSGRDNNSGTRVNTFGETGYGIFQAPNQVMLNTNNGTMMTFSGELEGINEWTTISGYASGGTLAVQLGYNCSGVVDQINSGTTGLSIIGYLGISDSTTALSAGASQVSYDGVLESPTAIIEGQYEIWGNEYCYHLASPSSAATSVFGRLTAASPGGITGASDGSTTFDISKMHADRNGPTSDPVNFE
jgi:hypothetical protein